MDKIFLPVNADHWDIPWRSRIIRVESGMDFKHKEIIYKTRFSMINYDIGLVIPKSGWPEYTYAEVNLYELSKKVWRRIYDENTTLYFTKLSGPNHWTMIVYEQFKVFYPLVRGFGYYITVDPKTL